jgi:hypothetical protein
MTTFQENNENIHYHRKFGFIINNQVIITIGSEKNKIQIAAINKVNLIKSKVF